VRIAAAVDKFKGTASAHDVARAIGHACWELGHECDEVPLADGGEGTLDILGGSNRTSTVTGPLGGRVEAQWRFHQGTAVIEMARASGLALIGGPDANDPVQSSTIGTGELIDHALDLGASRIIVCLGGSATTDGGLGALDAIRSPARLKAVEFIFACDVTTSFTDAARVFGPQKGATPAQVRLLTNRLEQLAQRYFKDYGVDVTTIEGAGAAGGLAGALAALGAQLIPGFDMIADEVNLDDRLLAADIVITGEGCFDATSVEGKVVGGVIDLARAYDKPVAGIFGSVDLDDVLDANVDRPEPCVSISDLYGTERAMSEPLRCIEQAALDIVRTMSSRDR
jgi:glycerate kinase